MVISIVTANLKRLGEVWDAPQILRKWLKKKVI